MSTAPGTQVRRPGRPAQFDRDRALTELCLLFWTKGYEAATQEEMLAATGLSSSTLYRSFGTKPDILAATLTRYLAWADAMFAPLEDGHQGVADVQAFLTNLRAQFQSTMATAGCLAWNTMQDPINDDPRIKTLTDRHMQRLRAGLTAALGRAVDAGELTPSAPGYLVDVLRAGVLGIQARGRAGEVDDALTLLDGLVALLDRGEQ